MYPRSTLVGLFACLATLALPVHANDVSVLASEFRQSAGGTWQVSATLEHADDGVEHYADAWRVVGEDGSVFGTRVLYHPHDAEQPFTRSLSGVTIPANISVVFVEAHDKVHGWSSQRLPIDLTKATGGVLRVER